MDIQSLKRNWVWIALVCTLAATAWAALNDGDEATVGLSPSTTSHHFTDKNSTVAEYSSHRAVQQNALPLEGFRRPQISNEPQDLFGMPSTAQAQLLAQSTAPAAPQLPPLPFLYAGKLFEDGRYMVFMIQGERNLAVIKGDVIDKVWRVKNIKPPNMILSYLPLKMDAVLDIGESN